jgi:hypothetical protein
MPPDTGNITSQQPAELLAFLQSRPSSPLTNTTQSAVVKEGIARRQKLTLDESIGSMTLVIGTGLRPF